jgi:hypothetical protein
MLYYFIPDDGSKWEIRITYCKARKALVCIFFVTFFYSSFKVWNSLNYFIMNYILNYFIMLASDINIIQEISELPLNTEATSTQFVNLPVIINGSIYPSKEFFTDENICGFVFFTNTFVTRNISLISGRLS